MGYEIIAVLGVTIFIIIVLCFIYISVRAKKHIDMTLKDEMRSSSRRRVNY